MLKKTHVTVTVPVVDLKRAESFYENKLGLDKKGVDPSGAVLLSTGETEIELYKGSAPPRADHTVMSFGVLNIENEIRDLEGKGVKFEDYNLPDFKTDANHIFRQNGDKAAWFKDSEGNVLCLHEHKSKNGK